MKLSAFGKKFSGESGIVELMDDLGSALLENPGMIMMGGGNPARLPILEDAFRRHLLGILDDPDRRHRVFGLYQPTAGEQAFRETVARFLTEQFGWNLTADNIGVSNGSQSALFLLLNLFAGELPDGSHRTIHLPISPEYLGYADSGLADGFFSASRPEIRLLEDRQFKYVVDFDALDPGPDVGALLASRPTNPTGNVLTDEEIARLDIIARERSIPLILDGAYGPPFPNILFTKATPHWNENTILALSLSKLGLNGLRTGIIVAREDIIRAYSNANGIVNLACGNIGPAIAAELFRSGEILSLTHEHVTPFYRKRAADVVGWLRQAMGDLPYRVHKPEGAFFLWLWLQDLPGGSAAFYERLKQRGVLVVPGHHCFFGLKEDWPHSRECIRVSYVQDEAAVRKGIGLIADEARKVFAEG
ncbi:MAG: valine--pyruvate transaminase [Xanthomonadales bacterium]|nr:valine--pyruvate transaminase [Xanthomonadales bacterium]